MYNHFSRIITLSSIAAVAAVALFTVCTENPSVSPQLSATGTPSTGWYDRNPSASEFILFNADDLAGLAKLVNGEVDFRGNVINVNSLEGKTIKLALDVDLSTYYGANYNGGKGWVPIGSEATPFNGVFDGNGKVIRGLYINDGTLGYVGLFGYGYDIRNVGVVDVDITGGYRIGGVVGQGGAANCYSTGTVRGTNDAGDVGGVVGSGGLGSFRGSANNCYSTCTVSGVSRVGGVIGYGSADNCYSTGTVSGSFFVGGVAGGGSVSGGYSTGNVSGVSFIGGVAGGGSVVISYSTGNVSGVSFVGGVLGNAETNASVASNYSTGNVSGDSLVGGVVGSGRASNCYSTGVVSGEFSYVGGVVGNVTGGNVTNCYSTGAVSGASLVGGIAGGIASGTNYDGSNYRVANCAALNSNVKAASDVGRVFGDPSETSGSTGNVAYFGIMDITGSTSWPDKGLTRKDGLDLTVSDITSSGGTILGLFTQSAWTIQNGKLPGLGDKPVEMPEHIK